MQFNETIVLNPPILNTEFQTSQAVRDRDGVVGGANARIPERILIPDYRLTNCVDYLVDLVVLLVH